MYDTGSEHGNCLTSAEVRGHLRGCVKNHHLHHLFGGKHFILVSLDLTVGPPKTGTLHVYMVILCDRTAFC